MRGQTLIPFVPLVSTPSPAKSWALVGLSGGQGDLPGCSQICHTDLRSGFPGLQQGILPLHSSSLQKICLPSVPRPHHQSCASACPDEDAGCIPDDVAGGVQGHGEGLQILLWGSPALGPHKCFCIPFLSFSTCTLCLPKCFLWFSSDLQLVSWGRRAIPGLTT